MTTIFTISKYPIGVSLNKLKAVIFLFSFILYGNSLYNAYSLDDELVTNTDRQIHPLVDQGISGIPEIFTSHYAQNSEQTYEYRPVVLTTFAIEKSIFGTSNQWVHISHFIQVVLYGLLGLVLFSLLNQIFSNEKIAFSFLITMVFLSLPVHTEVVNSLKNRDEILSLLFSLLAFSQAFKYIDHKKWLSLLWGLLFLLLALMSKKTALPFLIIIPLGIYLFRGFDLKKIGFILLALFSARIIFALFKTGLIDDVKVRTFSSLENPLFEQDFMSRIPYFFYSIFWYLKSALVHMDFHFYYGLGAFPNLNFKHPLFIFSGILVIGLLAIVGWGFIKRKHQGFNFGVLFFLLSILGACNLIFPMVGIVAERLVFTASLGVVLAFAFAIYDLKDRSWLKGITLPIVVLSFIGFNLATVILRNPQWKDRISLYENDTRNNFPSAKSQALYGQELQYLINQEWLKPSGQDALMFSRMLKAKKAYELSLSILPNYPKISNNLAFLNSMYFQNHEECISITNKLIQQNPKFKEAYENELSAYLKTFTTWCKMPHDSDNVQSRPYENSISAFQPEFSLIQQFEERGKAILSKGMNPVAIQSLIEFAKGIETINSKLKNLQPSFHRTIEQELNLLYTGKKPSYNVLDTFRFALYKKLDHPLSIQEYNENKTKLRDTCIQKALYFDQKFKTSWAIDLVDQYFLAAQDFEGIIDIHKKRVKAGSGNGKDYIQIGNSYLNLGEKEKAKIALYKGVEVLKKSNKPEDLQEALSLQKFIDKISIPLNP